MRDMDTQEIDRLTSWKRENGGHSGLAVKLNQRGYSITSQAISQWKKVPAAKVLDVEAITGISRHELRPDIFGEKR